jgi:probable F420-dependent oxidoreductase
MTHPVSFSIRLPNSGPYTTRNAVAEVAVVADELGFEALTVHDHISRSRKQNRHFSAGSVDMVLDGQDPILYEAMTVLTYAAAITRRIRLFPTGITLPTRDPRLLCKQAATLHELSGGRFMLGITIGASADEFDVMQVPFNERGRRTDEYLEVIRGIFDPQPLTSFDGRTVSFRNGEFYPKPRGLPIWVCGKAEAAMRRVAHYGEGFLPAGFTLDVYREKILQLDAQLAQVGRTRRDVICGLETFILIRDDAEEAMRDAASTLVYWYKDIEKGKDCNLVGTPAMVIEQMRGYVEIGVTHFELKFIAKSLEDQLGMMRLIAAKVVPAFASMERRCS